MNKLPLIVLATAVAGAANAAITLNVGTSINGDNPGTGLTALLESAGSNSVKLTMTNGLPAGSYVPFWLFNVDSSVGALTISNVGGVAAQSATRLNNGYVGGNQVKAGKFDLQFAYDANAGGSEGDQRFKSGMTSVYTISGTGLNLGSFRLLSADDLKANGGKNNVGNYYSAADVRFGNGKSGSVGATEAVPEPASMAALGLGALGLLKRRKKA
ncbi:PEP-CTERM sorting domain-containing protein [bacterium]|nr:MAG: PEP-CTERM sorting domain-containing protein [bacterium]